MSNVELPKWKRIIVVNYAKFSGKVLLLASGIYNVNFIKKSIKEFDKDYPHDENKISAAPVIISNHISFLDSVMLVNYFQPSFVAKKEV